MSAAASRAGPIIAATSGVTPVLRAFDDRFLSSASPNLALEAWCKRVVSADRRDSVEVVGALALGSGSRETHLSALARPHEHRAAMRGRSVERHRIDRFEDRDCLQRVGVKVIRSL